MYRIFVLLIMLSCPVLADTGIPWVGGIIHDITAPTTILVYPDGSGPPLSEARSGGTTVDATISARLVDLYGYPIFLFPPEDIWLQFDVGEGTATGCFNNSYFPGGIFMADESSDVDGWIQFAQPLRGGGWSEVSVTLYLNGSPAMDPGQNVYPPLTLGMVSPDINGDLSIDLVDIAQFVQDLHDAGTVHPRSDFNNDAAINLADIVLMTQGIGTVCE